MMILTNKDLLENAQKQISFISTGEAEALRNKGVTFIDVRASCDFDNRAIAGAISIPRGLLEFNVDEHYALKDRQRPYVVYCRTGSRAILAAETLKAMGFVEVYVLDARFEEWCIEGRRIETYKPLAVAA